MVACIGEVLGLGWGWKIGVLSHTHCPKTWADHRTQANLHPSP